jgi:hypothetical protein
VYARKNYLRAHGRWHFAKRVLAERKYICARKLLKKVDERIKCCVQHKTPRCDNVDSDGFAFLFMSFQ